MHDSDVLSHMMLPYTGLVIRLSLSMEIDMHLVCRFYRPILRESSWYSLQTNKLLP